MAEISASDVMKLRNVTGLSMMECKKALVEAGGDAEKATEILRIAMKGKMDTKTDRPAGDGRVDVATTASRDGAAIVEVRAETDFTAKNPAFVAAVQKIAAAVLESGNGAVAVNPKIQAIIDELRISTGENCSYARGQRLGAPGSVFGTYVHHDGKTAVLVQAEGAVPAATLSDVCMHVAAGVPTVARGLTAQDVPAEVVEKERKFRLAQAMESGKPKEIAEKMVEGGIRKFFEEVALLEQPFVKDPTRKIKDVVGSSGRLTAFRRWQVGEQVEA